MGATPVLIHHVGQHGKRSTVQTDQVSQNRDHPAPHTAQTGRESGTGDRSAGGDSTRPKPTSQELREWQSVAKGTPDRHRGKHTIERNMRSGGVLASVGRPAQALFWVLVNFAGRDHNGCWVSWPSVKTLGECLSYRAADPSRQVYNVLKELERARLVLRVPGGGRISNMYHLVAMDQVERELSERRPERRPEHADGVGTPPTIDVGDTAKSTPKTTPHPCDFAQGSPVILHRGTGVLKELLKKSENNNNTPQAADVVVVVDLLVRGGISRAEAERLATTNPKCADPDLVAFVIAMSRGPKVQKPMGIIRHWLKPAEAEPDGFSKFKGELDREREHDQKARAVIDAAGMDDLRAAWEGTDRPRSRVEPGDIVERAKKVVGAKWGTQSERLMASYSAASVPTADRGHEPTDDELLVIVHELRPDDRGRVAMKITAADRERKTEQQRDAERQQKDALAQAISAVFRKINGDTEQHEARGFERGWRLIRNAWPKYQGATGNVSTVTRLASSGLLSIEQLESLDKWDVFDLLVQAAEGKPAPTTRATPTTRVPVTPAIAEVKPTPTPAAAVPKPEPSAECAEFEASIERMKIIKAREQDQAGEHRGRASNTTAEQRRADRASREYDEVIQLTANTPAGSSAGVGPF